MASTSMKMNIDVTPSLRFAPSVRQAFLGGILAGILCGWGAVIVRDYVREVQAQAARTEQRVKAIECYLTALSHAMQGQ